MRLGGLAYLDPARQRVQRTVEPDLNPPKIVSGTTPTILVIFLGDSKSVPVETGRTDLEFARYTHGNVLRDTASNPCFRLKAGTLTMNLTRRRTLCPNCRSRPQEAPPPLARWRLVISSPTLEAAA
jgi:hypothetical protein